MLPNHMSDPILAEIRRSFAYCPDSGIVRWNISKPRIRCGTIAGTLNKTHGTLTVFLNGTRWALGRIAWALHTRSAVPLDCEIDHINRNPRDNRLVNLRCVSKSINQQNKGKYVSNVSGFTGVRLDDRYGTWGASIHLHGKRHHLGTFDTPEEAHQAYLEAKRRMHPGCTI